MTQRTLLPIAALTLLALAGTASAQFQTSVNGAKVNERVFNDFPNSTLVTVNDFPNEISFDDTLTANAAGGGFANRHTFNLSGDGGATPLGLTGPDDFFDVSWDITLTGTPATPRKEAGFLLQVNQLNQTAGIPVLDANYIVNSDAGEIVAFGDPFAFASLGNNSGGNGYANGSTIRMGMRYYKDTDNLYKIDFSASNRTTLTRILTNYNGYDFGTLGLPAGTIVTGYAQFTGADTRGQASFANITPNNPVPEPASMAALGLGALALLKRRRKA